MISMCALSRLYELSANVTIHRAPITHSCFRDYSIGINRLLKTLGDAADEELWKQVLVPLKRYRFTHSAAPLPFNDESLSITAALSIARGQLSFYERAYPVAAEQLATILDLGATLQNCPDNPIRDFILERFPKGVTSGAVVLKASWLITPSQRSLHSHPATRTWEIVTAGQLRKEGCYSYLIVVGAARWFPEYLITAPRGSDIYIVRYGWIRDVMPNRQAFDRTWQKDGTRKGADSECVGDLDEVLDAEDLLPQIDWAAIQQHVIMPGESGFDDVPAKIAVLEGNFAVFFEDDEAATVLTLDLETDEPIERVLRTPVRRIAPNMFVLLRTTGGGDYILPLADKILGKVAPYVRKCQREWKEQLRRTVAQSSLAEVSVRLIEAGSTCANEVNVSNWMSPRNIKTQDPRDFAAIMETIGFQHCAQEFWKAMMAISKAHQSAGQQIRRVLLRRLQDIDLTILERDGRLEISLPGVDAGTLTAFRVIDLAPADRLVPSTKLNHPFPLGDSYAPHAAR